VGDESHNGIASTAPDADPAEALEPEWFEEEVELVNEHGLHAYPAHVVAHVASCFKEADLLLVHGDRAVDPKSVLMLLGLSSYQPLVKGTRLVVRASGMNARTAVAVLAAVLRSGFGED